MYWKLKGKDPRFWRCRKINFGWVATILIQVALYVLDSLVWSRKTQSQTRSAYFTLLRRTNVEAARLRLPISSNKARRRSQQRDFQQRTYVRTRRLTHIDSKWHKPAKKWAILDVISRVFSWRYQQIYIYFRFRGMGFKLKIHSLWFKSDTVIED